MCEDNADTRKRIKQLENQNLKLQKLLNTAVDVTNQDTSGISALVDEGHTLAETLDNLEKQKAELETEIISVQKGGIQGVVVRLEKEHVDLKGKLSAVLSEIRRGDVEIDALKTEDAHLKAALATLESEKNKLLEELKMIEQNHSSLSQMSVLVQEKLSEIENKKASLTETKPPIENGASSEETILSNFKNLEKTYRDCLQALEDNASLEQKISELEARREGLSDTLDSRSSHRSQSQAHLSRMIESNTNVVLKIRHVKSALQNELPTKDLVAPKVDLKVSELEQQKGDLYDELEQVLENSSKEIDELREEISNPDIRRLINEIEVQKTVLLCNLKLLKIREEAPVELGSDPQSVVPTVSELEARVAKLTGSEEICNTSIGSSSSYQPSASCSPRHLEDEVVRLETERTVLLKRLHSVSETSARRLEERFLQTQSELHSTFMKEKSSEVMVVGKNYDDATNQLYGSDDARLGQRIRELEMENERIRLELEVVLEQIRVEQNGLNQVPVVEILRDRIDEMEMKTAVTKNCNSN